MRIKYFIDVVLFRLLLVITVTVTRIYGIIGIVAEWFMEGKRPKFVFCLSKSYEVVEAGDGMVSMLCLDTLSIFVFLGLGACPQCVEASFRL